MSVRRKAPRGLSPDDASLWSRAMQDTTPLRDRAKWLEPARIELRGTVSDNDAKRLRRAIETPSGPAPKGPLGIDGAMEKRMRRGAVEVDATLDLHGQSQARAHEQLIRFLSVAEVTGRRVILVITGKGAPKSEADFDAEWRAPEGRGVLRKMLPIWVREPPLADKVLTVRPAHMRHGGAGAFYVILRRSRGATRGT